jgi:hypothetical protein
VRERFCQPNRGISGEGEHLYVHMHAGTVTLQASQPPISSSRQSTGRVNSRTFPERGRPRSQAAHVRRFAWPLLLMRDRGRGGRSCGICRNAPSRRGWWAGSPGV